MFWSDPAMTLYPAPQLDLNRDLLESVAAGWVAETQDGNVEGAYILERTFHDLLLGRYDS